MILSSSEMDLEAVHLPVAAISGGGAFFALGSGMAAPRRGRRMVPVISRTSRSRLPRFWEGCISGWDDRRAAR